MSKDRIRDQQRIQAIQEKNEDVIQEIYYEYRSPFFFWLQKNYHCNQETCKDIYQMSFMIFIENIQTKKLEELNSLLKVYLFGIGKNIYKAYLRQNKNITLVKDDLLLDKVDELDTHTETTLQLKDTLLKQLSQGLLQIGDPCKSLLESFYYYRMSMQELADMLGYKNSHSARNQKYKCLARLRKIMESQN